MSSLNPYGPVIMSDGSVYAPDGVRLAPATATLDLTGPGQGRGSDRMPRAASALRGPDAAVVA
jgi:hypothetical protein